MGTKTARAVLGFEREKSTCSGFVSTRLQYVERIKLHQIVFIKYTKSERYGLLAGI